MWYIVLVLSGFTLYQIKLIKENRMITTWWLIRLGNSRISTDQAPKSLRTPVQLNLGPLHTQDWEPVTIHFKHSHGWKRWSWSKFASHYTWGTNGVCNWMQDGCKVYMAFSYTVSDGSCFMVIGSIFKNHLLEVGLRHNRETMALRTFTTAGLLYLIIVWGPACIIHRNNI